MIAQANIPAKAPEAKTENMHSGQRKTEFSHATNSHLEHLMSLQRTTGNQNVKRLFRLDATQVTPRKSQLGILSNFEAGELSFKAVIRRVQFGNDGRLSPARQAIVREAARIAERLVLTPESRRRWQAFWRGPAARITPRPTLENYQRAVRNRLIHDMDTSTNADVQEFVGDEASMPLERQIAGVTPVNSVNTYLRRFAVDQGIDTVVNLLLHESLHGAGLPMGPFMTYEPIRVVF